MLKRHRITIGQAVAAIEIYEGIVLSLIDVDLTEALTVADRLKIYAYDAYVIARALDQKCPLLTLDGGLSYAAKVAGVEVWEVN